MLVSSREAPVIHNPNEFYIFNPKVNMGKKRIFLTIDFIIQNQVQCEQ